MVQLDWQWKKDPENFNIAEPVTSGAGKLEDHTKTVSRTMANTHGLYWEQLWLRTSECDDKLAVPSCYNNNPFNVISWKKTDLNVNIYCY